MNYIKTFRSYRTVNTCVSVKKTTQLILNKLKFALCSDIRAKQINELCAQNAEVLGAFPKLRKATIIFVMSVCPSVRMEHLGFYWTNFYEILYLRIFRYAEKIQVSLESDETNGYFIFRSMYIYYHISLISSQNEKCFRQKL